MQGILELFIIVGAFQSGMLSFSLLFKRKMALRGNRSSYNTWLSMLFLAFSFSLLNEYIYLNFDQKNVEIFCLIFSVVLELVFGPLFYLYIRTIITAKKLKPARVFFHFIPAVSYFIFALVSLALSDYGVWMEENRMLKILIHGQLIAYIVFTSKWLYEYSQYLKNHYSSIFKTYRMWAKLIIVFFGLVTILDIAFDTATCMKIIGDRHILSVQNVCIIVIVFVIGIFCYLQIELLSSIFLLENQKSSLTCSAASSDEHSVEQGEGSQSDVDYDLNNKYQRNRLNDDEAKQLYDILVQYMEEHKPFKISGITLSQLADQLQISSHHLSQVINRYTGANFYNFINSYRVQEAKRLMDESPNSQEKIITFIYESGFNSTSTFNTFFKKIVGLTPTEYRNSRKQS